MCIDTHPPLAPPQGSGMLRMDMFMAMCIDRCRHNICVDMCIGMCADMFVDMCTQMCIDEFIDMCVCIY